MDAPSFMKGSLDLPGVGSVPKGAVIVVGGLAVVYVGYRWWKASSAPAPADTAAPADPGFTDAGTIPSVDGAVSADNSYGLPDSGGANPPSQDDYGFTGTTNDQWSQYVTIQLTQSAKWEYTAIVTALGQYLARKPLTSDQVQIVQAGIAVAGYPPEGSYTVITQGSDTPHIVAPANLRITSHGTSWIVVHWEEVAGASDYRVYANGTFKEMGGSDLASKVEGLSPDTSYTISVSAVTASGLEGPKASVSGRTSAEQQPSQPSPSQPSTHHGHRTWRISSTYPTVSQLVEGYNKHYHTHFSWREIWDYNLAHRSAATRAILKKRGPDHVFHGSAFWFPY